MKKVININFQGRVIPIEESAYEILQRYIETLRNFFVNEEGKDEIINDIEGRIAELFSEVLKKGSTCITMDDVNAVINSIGRPEDFEGEEAKVHSQLNTEAKEQTENASYRSGTYTNARRGKLYRYENDKILGGVCSGIANYFDIDPTIIRVIFVVGFGITFVPYLILWAVVPSSATKQIGSSRKRLMRDSDAKFIGGVCSGLAHYFNVNVWIPRVLFLIPFISIAFQGFHFGQFNFPNLFNLSFSPGASLVYIILWLILPEAKSTSEKLEMKGEKVDLNSIKNSITGEMKGVQERMTKFGREAASVAKEKSEQFGNEFTGVARRSGKTLGDIIALIFKIFAYFILAIVLLSVVASLFGIGIVLTGMLPLKNYLISSGWQNVFAWGTLILFIWVPVIGIITWIVRKVARIKSNHNVMRYSFLSLWLLGLFCLVGLISSLANDFSSKNTVSEQVIPLSNTYVDKLELKAQPFMKYYSSPRWLHLEPFAEIDADSVYVKNVRIRIVKADSDNFNVKMVRLSNGATRHDADARASKINYSIYQKDSLLMLDKGIAITPNDKFRNQAIIITVAVPVGKRILIHEDAGWSNFANEHIHFGWNHDDWTNYHNDYDNEAENWKDNVEYIMTTNGLKLVHPEDMDHDWESNDDNDDTHEQPEEIQQQKQELEELQQQKQELEERERKLENSLKTDSLHNKVDSAKYQYQKEEAAKPVVKQTETKHTLSGDVAASDLYMYSTKRFTM